MAQLVGDPPLTLSEELRWPQVSVIQAFEGYYPEEFFAGFNFPFIEDIVNSPPLLEYANWKLDKGEACGLPQPPQWLDKITARQARGGQGTQLGAFSQRGARPPVVSFGLSPDKHFSAAASAAAGDLPNETPCTVDPDLSFVAEMMVSRRSTISGTS